MIKHSTIIHFLFIVILTISCAAHKSAGQETSAQPPEDIEIHGNNQPKVPPPGGESKNYAPGEVLVKFHDGTDNKAIEAIQKDLHLEPIRVIFKPNLYLMKILDGSSVDSVIERLRGYKEVHYSEPNYVRTTN